MPARCDTPELAYEQVRDIRDEERERLLVVDEASRRITDEGEEMATKLVARASVLCLVISLTLFQGAKVAAAFDSWHQLAVLPVGSGAGEVGYQLSVQGGVARGPQALSVGDDQRLYVLDSINARVHVLAETGELISTIVVEGATYPLDILADGGFLYVLDESGAVLKLTRGGRLQQSYPLPGGMDAHETFRLAKSQGDVVLWADGYNQLPLTNLPKTINLRQTMEKGNRASRGLIAPIGTALIGELNGPTSAHLVHRDGAKVTEFRTFGSFGSARPIAFDSQSGSYFVVEDLFDEDPIRVEASLRHYTPNGEVVGAARLPTDEYVLSPRRAVDVSASGTVFAMVPATEGLRVYRVDLGATYRSQIPARVLPTPVTTRSSNASILSSISFSRKQVYDRANTMATTTWTWNTNFDKFSNGNPRGAYSSPEQLVGDPSGTGEFGIPYAMGGFDTPWSHTDGSSWPTFAGSLSPGDPGPLVGNTSGSWAGSDSSGVDCSGFIYAAAGFTTNPKMATSHLISSQNNSYAGWDAGSGANVQPMNYFVRNDSVQHAFYYQARKVDASGIWTLESTADSTPDAAKAFDRTWLDVNGYTQRSWWLFNDGDTPARAITSSGPKSACYQVAGQTVWFTYTAAAGHWVTLNTISGGDPDLWVLDSSLNTVIGSSVLAGTSNEAVWVPSGGTYYAFVHIYSSGGGCVNFTIGW